MIDEDLPVYDKSISKLQDVQLMCKLKCTD